MIAEGKHKVGGWNRKVPRVVEHALNLFVLLWIVVDGVRIRSYQVRVDRAEQEGNLERDCSIY